MGLDPNGMKVGRVDHSMAGGGNAYHLQTFPTEQKVNEDQNVGTALPWRGSLLPLTA